jgi:hypothetical protein
LAITGRLRVSSAGGYIEHSLPAFSVNLTIRFSSLTLTKINMAWRNNAIEHQRVGERSQIEQAGRTARITEMETTDDELDVYLKGVAAEQLRAASIPFAGLFTDGQFNQRYARLSACSDPRPISRDGRLRSR